jgi:hypothetical protein
MGGNDAVEAFSPPRMNQIGSSSGGSDLRVRVTISFSSGGSCVGACISNAWFGTGLIVVWSRSKYGFRQLA